MSEIKIYNLRIVPSRPIFEQVVRLKKKFEVFYGKQPLSKSRPHITIVAFKMYSQDKDILLKAFGQLSSMVKFKLDIHGFDIFDNSKVLHLKVSKTKEIENILTQIKILWIRDLHRKLTSLKIVTTPHITISKTEGEKMLYDSLAFFQKIEYPKIFEVNQLTLVSRYEGKSWDWEYQIELS